MCFTEPMDTKKTKTARGRPFQKGQNGNLGGERKGTRNAGAEAQLDGVSAALTRRPVAMAHKYNKAAMRLVFVRILPPRRDRLLHFELPRPETADVAMAAISRIADRVGEGELSDSEVLTLVGLVHTFLERLAQVEPVAPGGS